VAKVRAERLNRQLAESVAFLLQRRVKDPRLAPVAVTRASVSQDLRSARIWYGVLSADEAAGAEAAKALEKAKGFIRSALGEAMALRRIPEIRFEPDLNAAHAARLGQILAAISPEGPEAGADGAGQEGEAGGPPEDAPGLPAADPKGAAAT
jgi:ribosome-binding factor A